MLSHPKHVSRLKHNPRALLPSMTSPLSWHVASPKTFWNSQLRSYESLSRYFRVTIMTHMRFSTKTILSHSNLLRRPEGTSKAMSRTMSKATWLNHVSPTVRSQLGSNPFLTLVFFFSEWQQALVDRALESARARGLLDLGGWPLPLLLLFL